MVHVYSFFVICFFPLFFQIRISEYLCATFYLYNDSHWRVCRANTLNDENFSRNKYIFQAVFLILFLFCFWFIFFLLYFKKTKKMVLFSNVEHQFDWVVLFAIYSWYFGFMLCIISNCSVEWFHVCCFAICFFCALFPATAGIHKRRIRICFRWWYVEW